MPDGTGVAVGGAGAAPSSPAPSPGAGAASSPVETPTPTQGPINGNGASGPGPIPYERFSDVNSKYQLTQRQFAELQEQFNALREWGREAYPVWKEHQTWEEKQRTMAGQNMDPADRLEQKLMAELQKRDQAYEQAYQGVLTDHGEVALHRGYTEAMSRFPWIFENQDLVDDLGDLSKGMGYNSAKGIGQKASILVSAAERMDKRQKARDAEVFARAKKNEQSAANVEGSPPPPIEGVEDLPDRPTESQGRNYFRKIWDKSNKPR